MKILSWISIVMIACALLCGLWMKFAPGDKDVNFHAMLSIATILVCFVTIVLYIIKVKSYDTALHRVKVALCPFERCVLKKRRRLRPFC